MSFSWEALCWDKTGDKSLDFRGVGGGNTLRKMVSREAVLGFVALPRARDADTGLSPMP